MLSFADLHCDTLLSCFNKQTDLSDTFLHINEQGFRSFDSYIQVFAHFIPEETPEKWAFFQDFLQYSKEILNKAQLPIFENSRNLGQKYVAVLSVEGGDFFKNISEAKERLPFLKQNNIIFFSMVYNHSNLLGCGCAENKDSGLTDLGKDVLELLEQFGIIPDISHTSFKTANEIMSLAKGPVCATHSNAYDLMPHRRNLRKEQLSAIAESGGLVGVNFYPPFLCEGFADIDDICRHIDYLINSCGENSVVFGCDFDGVDKLPKGINNLLSIEHLNNKMRNKGYSQNLIEKIFYKNIYGFLKENFGGKNEVYQHER